ncbi:MAG TPA: YIP1 family protein [Candidatus Paceibacterota bacterium]|nr:YIP1 family protein [Verrucomicrobiota bacterium]HSA09436.1 YIP1 family protein [Candidatus Paceibacterota bacterium]
MEEPPPVQETPPDASQPPAMSLAARLLNVFAIPGEVFEGVKASRFSVGNWLVPALLLAVVGVFTSVVVVSQASFQQQMRERIEKQARALEEQVQAGKVQRVEADRALAFTRAITQPPVLKVLGGAAAAALSFARVFWWALILWLLGRAFLKLQLDYLKTLEVAGLALMISVLGGVVTLLLTVNLPQLFTAPSLALGVSDFDASRKGRLLLGVTNGFSFWLVGVLAAGLARLAGVPFLRAAWFVFAAWVIQESCLVLLGGALGQFVL